MKLCPALFDSDAGILRRENNVQRAIVVMDVAELVLVRRALDNWPPIHCPARSRQAREVESAERGLRCRCAVFSDKEGWRGGSFERGEGQRQILPLTQRLEMLDNVLLQLCG